MVKVFLLIVVGLAGDAAHEETFHKWGNSLAESAEKLGVTPERLVYLVDEPTEEDKRSTASDAGGGDQGARVVRRAGRSR